MFEREEEAATESNSMERSHTRRKNESGCVIDTDDDTATVTPYHDTLRVQHGHGKRHLVLSRRRPYSPLRYYPRAPFEKSCGLGYSRYPVGCSCLPLRAPRASCHEPVKRQSMSENLP